ncbi:RNA-directed DNA polymerase, eukaryota [Tanacetum coccineum]
MVDHNRKSFNSKEDQTTKISKTVFLTNFPDHVRAGDLWNVCNAYGSVIDVYIPFKKSKAGKRFAFIRFIKVINLELLIENLCTIWISNFHLHASKVRYQRDQKPKPSFSNNAKRPESFRANFPTTTFTGNSKSSFASILKEGPQVQSPDQLKPALVLDDSCLKERDFSMSLMGKVREVSAIPNLYIILDKEGFNSVNLTYLGGLWVLIELDSSASKEKFLNHVGVGSWFSSLKQASNSFISDERIVWISIEGLPINAWTTNTFLKIASMWGDLVVWEDSEVYSLSCKHLCLKTKIDTIINESFKIILRGKVYWVRAKELDAWNPQFLGENPDNSSSDDESSVNDKGRKYGDNDHQNTIEDNKVDRVSESSCMRENVSKNHDVETSQSKDPFNIYELLTKKKHNVSRPKESDQDNVPQSKESDLTFPPGFTPDLANNVIDKGENVTPSTSIKEQVIRSNKGSPQQRSTNMAIVEGSILEVMDDLVKVGQTYGSNMEGLLKKHRAYLVTQGDLIYYFTLARNKDESKIWFYIKALWGNFTFDHAISSSVGNSGGIICVWGPSLFIKDQISSSDYFLAIMGTWTPTSKKLLIILVYAPQELTEKRDLWGYIRSMINRWEGETVILGDFNEVRTEQERFVSIFNVQGANMFNNFISMANLIDLPLGGYSYTWAHKSATKMSKLDRFLVFEGLLALFPYLSGICLDRHLSYHRPILMCESVLVYGPTPFRMYHSWFKMEGFNKFVEDSWNSMNISDPNAMICLKKKFQTLKYAIKKLQYINSIDVSKLSQKAKVRWAIEEDENSKFFHGIINNKRSQLAIQLQYINSIDVSELSQKAKVRWAIEGDENSKFFHGIINNKISQLAIRRTLVDGDWIVDPSKNEQVEDLERATTYDEIKTAVWDCGNNKTPGPNGFSFKFFRKFWNLIDKDVVAAISEFFDSGKFPPGCNSSFIALIPMIQDAKVVKDYRPISLIGSMYKIIAKILANRLSLVMPDLISDVQSTFVANRKILDGPFILNELLSWCKYKKVNAMIFKVDFEKAFDSVRWDYLDDVLNSFGFGEKWRSWINGCLSSSMGSVLVNGNPTSEFYFHKGLKQGDPLSPFLFSLIMESLHLSFNRVLDAGLHKGISINNSLMISHLFYADDAVFVGKWDPSNIKTIVHVLKCFYLASGLKINLHKTKLMGISINKEEIDLSASIMGCSTFSSPFKYLGVQVGASMSRLNSWNEVETKISSRLSRWKLKTLSIGGRLTLLKSVLSAIPLYHMSLFKVPTGTLHSLESIRRDFFNGIDRSERKMVFIKAIHGAKGGLDTRLSSNRNSIWLDIVRDISSLDRKWIDLLSFVRNKVDISVADKLRHATLDFSFRRHPRGGAEEEQFRGLSSCLIDVILPQIHDRWFWSLDGSGDFSVKSVRNFIDDSLLPKLDVPTRWVKLVPIKVNILAWRLRMDRLPTRLNLSSRGLEITSLSCPLCNEVAESTSHIFFLLFPCSANYDQSFALVGSRRILFQLL